MTIARIATTPSPEDRHWPSAALFDLDGTLIDSVPDITEAVAELMASEGLARFSEDEVRGMVGHGMPVLVERALKARGLDPAAQEIAQAVDRMSGIYPRHLVNKTRLMPGAVDALDYLASIDCRIAVVTNKPEEPARIVLEHFGLMDKVDLLLGDRGAASGGLRRKPAPDMLRFALGELAIASDAAVMVGDSGADIQSAQAAGLLAIAVEGGYAHAPLASYGPDLILASLADLKRALSEASHAG